MKIYVDTHAINISEKSTVVQFSPTALAFIAEDYVILIRTSDGLCKRFTYADLGFKE